MVFKNGQMVQNMKDIGKITKLMAKEYFGMFTVTNTKDGGNEIKLMDMENIPIVMEQHMKVTGKMTSNMAKV